MESTPIIDIHPITQLPAKKFESQILPTNLTLRLASRFKECIGDALLPFQKSVYINFEILTRKKLIESLQSGCRILQINCSYVEQDCLCAESVNGAIDRISFPELQKIFLPGIDNASKEFNNLNINSPKLTFTPEDFSPSGIDEIDQDCIITGRNQKSNPFDFRTQKVPFLEIHMVQILILGMKNLKNLTETFINLQIPHIIVFEFTGNEAEYQCIFYESECIQNFSIFFYEALTAQKLVSEAFALACDKVFAYLSKRYFGGKPRNYITSILGPGPLLLPQDADHNEPLFSPGQFPLAQGRIENITSNICPTNVKRIPLPFIGRHEEFSMIVQRISRHCRFLEVTGPGGMGKTTIVLQIAHYIRYRNMFSDGIFYIPLKNFKDQPNSGLQLEDFLKHTLGHQNHFSYERSFKNKNLLLIFDDFELFYEEKVEFPQTLFMTLKQCGITCIIVAQTHVLNTLFLGNGFKKREESRRKIKEAVDSILEISYRFELQGLSEDELALIVQILTKNDENNEFASLQEIKACGITKEAQGNPKYVIERLFEGKIKVQKKVLQMSASFQKYFLIRPIDLKSNDKETNFIPYKMFQTGLQALKESLKKPAEKIVMNFLGEEHPNAK